MVAKRSDGRYQPGRRGWLKYRTRSSTKAIIDGVTGTLHDPETLLLGRLDTAGRLHYTGRTHPLTAPQRRELGPLLTPAAHRTHGVEHPWTHPLPATWTGQLERPQPLPYHEVEPNLVAETQVDTAYEHHRWRHRVRYLHPRLDVSAYDVPLLMP